MCTARSWIYRLARFSFGYGNLRDKTRIRKKLLAGCKKKQVEKETGRTQERRAGTMAEQWQMQGGAQNTLGRRSLGVPALWPVISLPGSPHRKPSGKLLPTEEHESASATKFSPMRNISRIRNMVHGKRTLGWQLRAPGFLMPTTAPSLLPHLMQEQSENRPGGR